MSRADVEAGVKAALEAAADKLHREMPYHEHWPATIRNMDPVAIAATVEPPTDVPLDVHVRLLEEVTALRQRIAELEHALDADQEHIAMLERKLAKVKK